MALITDTGPLFAAMDRSDRDHLACAQLFEKTKEQVLVPAPVIVELDWLTARNLHPDAFASFMSDIEAGTLQVVDLLRDDYVRAHQLLRQYRDLALGFVDAAIMAVVERLRESKLATLDRRHFAVVRPMHLPALRLIP